MSAPETKRRITVRRPEDSGGGKLLICPDTLDELKTSASEKLGIDVKRIFTVKGGEVDDVELLMNDDELVCTAGEEFNPSKGKGKATDSGTVSTYKLAVIGAGGVGKSALTLRYVQGLFVTDYDPTIEDAYRKPTEVDGEMAMMDILDTAGQEDYIALRSQWMREREAFLLVYSITDRQSFDDLLQFWEQLQDIHEDGVPVVICANKSDCQDQRVVTAKEGEEMAKFCNSSNYLETSAKTGSNVEKAFVSLIRQMRKKKPASAGGGSGKKKKKGPCSIL